MKQNLRFILLTLLCAVCSVVWGYEVENTVTIQYPGGTTTNMTGNNDAATFKLDATDWSVVGDKGNSSNFPGLNQAGDIRLYWSANGGNTLTVKSLNARK